jgi:hypothetical protein
MRNPRQVQKLPFFLNPSVRLFKRATFHFRILQYIFRISLSQFVRNIDSVVAERHYCVRLYL